MSSSAPVKVLIVEDNLEIRRFVASYLRRYGYGTLEASDGQEALDILDKMLPDLILLDVLLPRVDGIEVLRRLRSSPKTARVSVVMMSAVLQIRDLRTETNRLNVHSILQKPFQLRELLSHVEKALQSQSGSTVEGEARENSPTSREKEISAVKRQQMRGTLELSGTLENVSIPILLHAIFFEQKTGRLRVLHGIEERIVYFQNGFPVYAESSSSEDLLGAHLLRTGAINAEQHELARADMSQSGRQFGEALLKLKFIGPHQLFAEIEAHLVEKVVSLFQWFEGNYRFFEGDAWKDDIIVARMKPGRITLSGIQRYWTPNRVAQILTLAKGNRTFQIKDGPYAGEQLALTAREIKLEQMAKRRASVEEIVSEFGESVMVTLWGLYVVERIGFAEEKEAEKTLPKQDDSAKTKTADAIAKEVRANALLTEYLKFRTADYFALLGVSKEASEEEITAAFEKKQKRYHPDSLVGIDSGMVQERVEELYIRIHNAYKILLDPTTRAEYVRQLREKQAKFGGAEHGVGNRLPSTQNKPFHEMAFDEGVLNFKDGKYELARTYFHQANEIEPQPRYRAYEIWAEYMLGDGESGGKGEQTLVGLQREVPADPIIPYVLGNIALRQHDVNRAASYFEKAVKLDPRHIDAARQLRILRMRKRESEVSGLFDIFRKK